MSTEGMASGVDGMPAPEELAKARPIDMNEVAETRKGLLVAGGWWRTAPEKGVEARFWDTKPSEEDPTPRRMLSVRAAIVNKETGEEDRYSFNASFERRNDPRRPNKADANSKRGVALIDAFTKIMGRPPATDEEVRQYVESYALDLRIGQFTPSNGPTTNALYEIAPVTD